MARQSVAHESGNLLPQHQRMIELSGIDADVACERGYRSVTLASELKRLGFGERQARVPCLLVPVWNVVGEIGNYQARPDQPRVNERGKAVKYETPKNSQMLLDVPPRVRTLVGDPAVPLFVTEGVKKADAAVSKGICCIALLGVWNWRGSNDAGGKTALPDWEYIALKGRRVYICFDSDVMLKPEVHKAMERLKSFLEQRGADVALIYLPAGEAGEKVGLDDYLAAGNGLNDLLKLASPHLIKPLADPGDDQSGLPYVDTAIGAYMPTWIGSINASVTASGN